MPRTIRFHLDEHVDLAIADGLRCRGIDVTTTHEVKLLGQPDAAHLAFANGDDRSRCPTVGNHDSVRAARSLPNASTRAKRPAFPARPSEAPADANIASDAPSPEDLLLGEGQRNLVLAALGELRPAFREVVVLREMGGLSYREIADVTGAPIGTVMSRLSRARIELKTILTRLIDKDEPNAV